MLFICPDWEKDGEDPNWERCAGTLITSQFAVTAAHCVYQYQQLWVEVGLNDAWEWWGDNHLVAPFYTKNFTVHENFNPVTLENDIAVIKLPMKLDTDYLKPVCLAKTSDTTSYDNKMAQVLSSDWSIMSMLSSDWSMLILSSDWSIMSILSSD